MYLPTGQAKTEWRVSGPLAYPIQAQQRPRTLLLRSVENAKFWAIFMFLTSQIKAEILRWMHIKSAKSVLYETCGVRSENTSRHLDSSSCVFSAAVGTKTISLPDPSFRQKTDLAVICPRFFLLTPPEPLAELYFPIDWPRT
jgi:hypothetical protein